MVKILKKELLSYEGGLEQYSRRSISGSNAFNQRGNLIHPTFLGHEHPQIRHLIAYLGSRRGRIPRLALCKAAESIEAWMGL